MTGKSPLLLAISKDLKEIITILIENGASISSLPYHQRQPVGSVIDATRNSRRQDDAGKPVPEATAETDFVKNREGLLSTNQFTQHPFDLAIKKNRKKIAQLLLDTGVQLSQEVLDSTFPHILRNSSYGMADRLIKQGANVNMDMLPGIPLLNAVLSKEFKGWKRKRNTVVYLCENGVDVNVPDKKTFGFMPLHHAARNNEVAIAEILLAHGANINSRSMASKKSTASSDSITPLVAACSSYRKEMIHFLLERGADPNIVGKHVRHPLLVSKIMTDPEIVRLLLEHHADPNIVNSSNNSPLFFAAAQTQSIESVRLLLQYGANPNQLGKEPRGWRPEDTMPLKVAVKAGNLAAAKILVDHGAAIRVACMQGMVVDAMVKKNDNIVRFLTQSGAELNDVKGSGQKKWLSPLMYAAQIDHEEYLQLFLDNGAEIDLLNEIGDTALIKAAAANSEQAVRLLLDRGAKVDIQNSYGDTALIKAVMAGKLSNVKLLLAHGANPSLKNNKKLTPYWIAKQSDNQKISSCLVAHGAESLSYQAFAAKIATLKVSGIIPAKVSTEKISPLELDFFLSLISREFGINKPESHMPDPRLSSPLRTWQSHKEALLKGDFSFFKKTLTRPSHPLVEIYEQLTPEKRRKMAEEMRPITPIIQDGLKAKFRIHRLINGEDITSYIYFSKIFGEWKIDEY